MQRVLLLVLVVVMMGTIVVDSSPQRLRGDGGDSNNGVSRIIATGNKCDGGVFCSYKNVLLLELQPGGKAAVLATLQSKVRSRDVDSQSYLNAVDAANGVVYALVVDGALNTLSFYQYNVASHALSTMTVTNSTGIGAPLTMDFYNGFLYLANAQNHLFAVNVATGIMSDIGLLVPPQQANQLVHGGLVAFDPSTSSLFSYVIDSGMNAMNYYISTCMLIPAQGCVNATVSPGTPYDSGSSSGTNLINMQFDPVQKTLIVMRGELLGGSMGYLSAVDISYAAIHGFDWFSSYDVLSSKHTSAMDNTSDQWFMTVGTSDSMENASTVLRFQLPSGKLLDENGWTTIPQSYSNVDGYVLA